MFTTEARDAMLDRFGELAHWVEITDGSAAIGHRHLISWKRASDGTKDFVVPVTFQVPPNSTVRGARYWSDEDGGELLASTNLTPETFTLGGEYTLTTTTLAII